MNETMNPTDDTLHPRTEDDEILDPSILDRQAARREAAANEPKALKFYTYQLGGVASFGGTVAATSIGDAVKILKAAGHWPTKTEIDNGAWACVILEDGF